MTREEVIIYLKRADVTVGREPKTKTAEALEMAIKALEQEPFINKSCVSSGVCEHDKNVVIDKIRAEIEQLPTNTRINWDGCCPDIDYPEIEYVDVTKNGLLSIIDKYKAESEDT